MILHSVPLHLCVLVLRFPLLTGNRKLREATVGMRGIYPMAKLAAAAHCVISANLADVPLQHSPSFAAIHPLHRQTSGKTWHKIATFLPIYRNQSAKIILLQLKKLQNFSLFPGNVEAKPTIRLHARPASYYDMR
jgi:hypothetical protein